MIPLQDRQGGPERPAAIFVAVLGASTHTYAEAAASQEEVERILIEALSVYAKPRRPMAQSRFRLAQR
jgi:transposase